MSEKEKQAMELLIKQLEYNIKMMDCDDDKNVLRKVRDLLGDKWIKSLGQ